MEFLEKKFDAELRPQLETWRKNKTLVFVCYDDGEEFSVVPTRFGGRRKYINNVLWNSYHIDQKGKEHGDRWSINWWDLENIYSHGSLLHTASRLRAAWWLAKRFARKLVEIARAR